MQKKLLFRVKLAYILTTRASDSTDESRHRRGNVLSAAVDTTDRLHVEGAMHVKLVTSNPASGGIASQAGPGPAPPHRRRAHVGPERTSRTTSGLPALAAASSWRPLLKAQLMAAPMPHGMPGCGGGGGGPGGASGDAGCREKRRGRGGAGRSRETRGEGGEEKAGPDGSSGEVWVRGGVGGEGGYGGRVAEGGHGPTSRATRPELRGGEVARNP